MDNVGRYKPGFDRRISWHRESGNYYSGYCRAVRDCFTTYCLCLLWTDNRTDADGEALLADFDIYDLSKVHQMFRVSQCGCITTTRSIHGKHTASRRKRGAFTFPRTQSLFSRPTWSSMHMIWGQIKGSRAQYISSRIYYLHLRSAICLLVWLVDLYQGQVMSWKHHQLLSRNTAFMGVGRVQSEDNISKRQPKRNPRTF